MRYWAVLCLFLAACANVVAPTGGERDTTPPTFVSALPENYQLNFEGGIIRINFDEYIKLQQTQNILISPSLEEKPEITERYKSVFIDLKGQKLSPNTTYTINFAQSITDLNEGNKLQDFRYVFSTGPYLDSLSVEGQVLTADKLEGKANLLVGLYPEEQGDSALYKHKPFYFGRTQEDGRFTLENLKYGRFRLFVFDDEDNNLLYKATEALAFADSVVVTDTTTKKYDLRLFVDPLGDPKPKDIKVTKTGVVRVKYTFPIDTATRVVFLNSQAAFRFLIEHDSLLIYHQERDIDSLRFVVERPNGRDTLRISNRRMVDRSQGIWAFQKPQNNFPSIYEPLELRFEEPIVQFDSSRFTWKRDSTEIALPFIWSIRGRSLLVQPRFEPNIRYELFIDSLAVQGFLGARSDTFRYFLNSGNAELYGNLLISELDSLQMGDLVQLLDEGGLLIRQHKWLNEAEIAFNRLRPNSYRLRVVRDSNQNDRFDGGSYVLKQQPEKIWIAPDLLRLRANWDLEFSLKGLIK